jgi:hypothetical protein
LLPLFEEVGVLSGRQTQPGITSTYSAF